MNLGVPQGAQRPSPVSCFQPPGPRLLAGDLLILHMPLIIPLPLFVLSQNCRTAAWHRFGYMPPRSVWCGALLFWECMASAYILLLFYPPSTQTGLVFYFFTFIPLSSIMYDSSHGATQSTRAALSAFEYQAGIYHQTRVAQSLDRGRGLEFGCWSEGKGGWGGGGGGRLIRRRACQMPDFLSVGL